MGKNEQRNKENQKPATKKKKPGSGTIEFQS
jgi:hypothetical protein